MNTTTTKQNTTTSAAGHTPGPWTVDGNYIHGPDGKRFLAVAGDGEGQANARLIAAAPELLDALKDAADMLRLMGVDMNGHDMTRNIQAAIAKATP